MKSNLITKCKYHIQYFSKRTRKMTELRNSLIYVVVSCFLLLSNCFHAKERSVSEQHHFSFNEFSGIFGSSINSFAQRVKTLHTQHIICLQARPFISAALVRTGPRLVTTKPFWKEKLFRLLCSGLLNAVFHQNPRQLKGLKINLQFERREAGFKKSTLIGGRKKG